MSWIGQLVETYENVKDTNAFFEDEHPLVPAGFVEKKAAIKVFLTESGAFANAERVDKNNNRFIIPSTPEAEGRVGQPAPYPLVDELRYVAGDYDEGGNPFFDAYFSALEDWCARPDAPHTLRLLRDYLAQRRLVSDMRAAGFDFDLKKDMKSFVLFAVQGIDSGPKGLWERADVRASWASRMGDRKGALGLCYVHGENLLEMASHPKFQGNAKLISSQCDKTIFQYKGRFMNEAEAVSVSYDASVKGHNALGWLLKRQGFDRYGMKVVAWTSGGSELGSPADENPLGIMGGDELPATFTQYGVALRDAARGLSERIAEFSCEKANAVVILGLTAATTGRMSINYYQEIPGNQYVERLLDWYRGCAWEMWEKSGRGISTPTPDDIAAAVLGKRNLDAARGDYQVTKAATKLVRQLRMRLLKCTVEGTPLPRDIVLGAFRRASAPQSFTDDNGKWQEFEWRKALEVACALVRKERMDQKKEETDAMLNENNRDRSYLYGRLLALADLAEYSAMDKSAYRQTNAIRYMQMFQQRPYDTWMKLHGLLLPYYGKLGAYSERYKKLIGQVEAAFSEGDRTARGPLEGSYLHGYYCQRQALFTGNKNSEGENKDDGAQE